MRNAFTAKPLTLGSSKLGLLVFFLNPSFLALAGAALA
jgi:hypothetical protein